MTRLPTTVLECIGNTSLVSLRRIVPDNGSRVLLKLENENPTGSMKDRMALAMIDAAERDGRLPQGGAVVEYTGGSTGVSLSLVCTVRDHPLFIVTSDAFAKEKRDHMSLLGAELTIVMSDGGQMTGQLTRDMIERARILAEETGAFWTDQFNNQDQIRGYYAMGDELWEQSDGAVDGFVQMVGTAGSIRGTGEALRLHNKSITIVAVEPAESPVLSGGDPGRTRLTAWELVSSSLTGRMTRPTGSTLCRRLRPWRWPCACPRGRVVCGYLNRRQRRGRPATSRRIGA